MSVRLSVDWSAMRLVDLLEVLAKGAECHDPYLHTGPDVAEYEPLGERAPREAVAIEVCKSVCPVRAACLEYAQRVRPSHGIWAGYRPEELAALRGQSVASAGVLGEAA